MKNQIKKKKKPKDFGFELITEEEIFSVRFNKGENDKNDFPMTQHYLSKIHNDDNDFDEMNNNENNEYNKIMKRENLLKYKNIPSIMIKLIYNIVYVMARINIRTRNNSRFLYDVLLKFSLISEETRNFLIERGRFIWKTIRQRSSSATPTSKPARRLSLSMTRTTSVCSRPLRRNLRKNRANGA